MMTNFASLEIVSFLLSTIFSPFSLVKANSDAEVTQYMALLSINAALNGIPVQMSAMSEQMQTVLTAQV
jgi:hypothetical protein